MDFSRNDKIKPRKRPRPNETSSGLFEAKSASPKVKVESKDSFSNSDKLESHQSANTVDSGSHTYILSSSFY